MSAAVSVSERLVTAIGARLSRRSGSRRGFLGGAALVGAALAVDPWGFLVRPASAYDAVCGSDSGCADGYSVFCCTINGGKNSCPPNSFVGGWWKADNSSFCGGAARYYLDCNAFVGGPWKCHCGPTATCDQRLVACTQFRYGQCNLDIPYAQTGPVVCRMVSCTPPWQQFGGICTSNSATDNQTATHTAPCIGPASAAGIGDGTFVQAPGGIQIYRIVGGAPIYVSSWSVYGGRQRVQVLTAAEWAGLSRYPADGVFVRDPVHG